MILRISLYIHILTILIVSFRSNPQNFVPSQVKFSERGKRMFLDITTKEITPADYTIYLTTPPSPKKVIEDIIGVIDSISFYFIKFDSFVFPYNHESLTSKDFSDQIKGSFQIMRFNVNLQEVKKLLLSYLDKAEKDKVDFEDALKIIDNKCTELFNDFISYEMKDIYKAKKIIDPLLQLPPKIEKISLSPSNLKYLTSETKLIEDVHNPTKRDMKTVINMPFYEVEKDKQQIGFEIEVVRDLNKNYYYSYLYVKKYEKSDTKDEYNGRYISAPSPEDARKLFEEIMGYVNDNKQYALYVKLNSFSKTMFVFFQTRSYELRIYPRFYMLYMKKSIWEKAGFTIPMILGTYILLTITFIVFKV
eukprot:GAHX01000670.1.p1 GENE.GAHX01000670.1~~GAHX01000670.1.p1  ORF type:complete len:362 (-),score=54.07 GAHX01000670.1:31-1116(-)